MSFKKMQKFSEQNESEEKIIGEKRIKIVL